MSYEEEEEELGAGFKTEDEGGSLDIPEDLDFGLDEEDPDRDI